MITKYFANVLVRFNPFSPAAKSSRLFLARVPASAKLNYKILDKETDIPEIKVEFKDKHVMTANPAEMSLEELKEHFNSHSRRLSIKDAIME